MSALGEFVAFRIARRPGFDSSFPGRCRASLPNGAYTAMPLPLSPSPAAFFTAQHSSEPARQHSFRAALSRAFRLLLSTATAVLTGVLLDGASNAHAQSASLISAEVTVASGLDAPNAAAVDRLGNVYIGESADGLVYKFSPGASGYLATVIASASNGQFGTAPGVAVDAAGDVFISDGGNDQIVKLTPAAGGYNTSVAIDGAAHGLLLPSSIAIDRAGNLYLIDRSTFEVVKETLSGGQYTQSVVASTTGNGLTGPTGVAVDGSGNVYIGDLGLRQILEESPTQSGYAQSVIYQAPQGVLFNPAAIAADSAGDVYLGDPGGQQVIELSPSPAGYTQTVLATGGTGLQYPGGIAADGAGNVYVADSNNNTVIKILHPNITFGEIPLGAASQTVSLFFQYAPGGLANTLTSQISTSAGSLFDYLIASGTTCVADQPLINNTCVVNVVFTPHTSGTIQGAVSLFDSAGNVEANVFFTGTAQAPQIAFSPGTVKLVQNNLSGPVGVGVGGDGSVYIADVGHSAILRETPSPSGFTPAIVPTPIIVPPDAPVNLSLDAAGNIYFTLIYGEPAQQITTLNGPAGTTIPLPQENNGSPALSGSMGIDAKGNVYIPDENGGVVYLYAPAPNQFNVSLLQDSTNWGLSQPSGIAVDMQGDLFIVDSGNHRIVKETPGAGGHYAQSVAAGFASSVTPTAIALDASGNLYFTTSGTTSAANQVYRATPASSTAYGLTSLIDPATTALNHPSGIAVDAYGNVYVADTGNGRVLELDLAEAPSLSFNSQADGTASTAKTVTVANIGNEPLDFVEPSTGSDPSFPANFPANANDPLLCTWQSPVKAGAYCDLPIEFKPLDAAVNTGSVVLLDNNLNISPSLQQVQLSGNGLSAQSILFTPPSQVSIGVAPIQLSASATSGLAVKLSVVSGPATLDGDFLIVNGLGSIVVTASQGGDSFFSAAPQVTRTIVVARITPAITWTTPAAITYPAALSATQLDATASVAGTFAYSPGPGKVLAAGLQTLSVTFTPADPVNYQPVTKTVTIMVNKAASAIKLTASAVTAKAGTTITMKAALSAPLNGAAPTGTVEFFADGKLLE